MSPWRYSWMLVLSSLGGCGAPAPVTGDCAEGKVCLHYGNLNEPGSLDPHALSGKWEARIIGELLIGLTQDDAQGNPAPGMATSWSMSADGLVWTFELREANWSDGVPVVAEDFVFALRRILDPATGSHYSGLLEFISNAKAISEGRLSADSLGVRAIDARTLEIKLEHPVPHLPEIAKHPAMLPLPRHQVQRWGDAWATPGRHVANGPYMLASWRLGDRVRLVRNPEYSAAHPLCIDEINFYPTTDSISAERRIRRGELDVNSDFQSNRADYLRKLLPGQVRTHRFLSTVYLVFNMQLPQFQSVRVRQALAMAIDGDFIAGKLLRAGQRPAHSFVPPGTANYPGTAQAAWAQWPLEQRQREARALLAQEGYGPDKPLRVAIKHRNAPDPMLFMPAIQADWRQIGVLAELVQNESQVAYAAYGAGDFEIADASWVADYNDATSFLHLLRRSTGQNYGRYHNAQFEALLDSAQREADLERRAGLLEQAERILLAEAPVAPVYFSVSRALVSDRVSGWVDNIGDWHRVQYLCFKSEP